MALASSASAGLRVELLGPVRVLAAGREIDLGGTRSRALVARLALAGGRPLPADAVIDDLWGDDLPADARGALQSVVSRTRRRLPDGEALSWSPAGYSLRVDSCDLADLERLLAARDPAAAGLWRGSLCADAGDPPFVRELAHGLEESRLASLELALANRLADGATAATVAEIVAFSRENPHREEGWRLRLEALAATGRVAEAVEAYEELRARLADDLGIDPSPALRDLHVRLLRGETTGQPRPAARRLPVALTSFVGRDTAVAAVVEALRASRLVTILGPGGAGKTRLAVEAARVVDTAEVWLAELAAAGTELDVVRLVGAALDLTEVSAVDRRSKPAVMDERQRLLDGAAALDGLLLLDNCEHVIDAAARLAADLLAHGPGLRIVATSRELLRVDGEAVYPLEPLMLPEHAVSVEEAREYSAVRLFVERARSADHAFALDDATLPAVIDIVSRLDGLPLAVELAAARLRTVTVDQIAARLGDRFRLLTGGSRTALPRHRTLRAVVDWSWDLLDDAERRLAERVAVFPAGITADGAAAVTGLDPDRAADLLGALVDKSLLAPLRAAGEPRFRMLETLREYGMDRLVEHGEVTAVREAHLDHMLRFLHAHDARLRGPEQLESLRLIDLEWGNIAAALRFAIDTGDRVRSGSILLVVFWYWVMRGQEEELALWAGEVAALPAGDDPSVELVLHAMMALAELERGERDGLDGHVAAILAAHDTGRVRGFWGDVVLAALDFFGLLGDRVLEEPTDPWSRAAVALTGVMLIDNAGQGPVDPARIEAAVEGFRAVGDRSGLAAALTARGNEESMQGRFDEAIASWQEALIALEQLGADDDHAYVRSHIIGARVATATLEQLGELKAELEALRAAATGERSRGIVTVLLARILLIEGDADQAVCLLESCASAVVPGNSHSRALLHALLTRAYLAAGRLEEAVAALRRGFLHADRTDDMPIVATLAVSSAHLALAEGDAPLAARRLGAADQIRGREDLSDPRSREFADRLREALGPAAFDEALAAGRALDRPAALALIRVDER
ncbi:MAG: BTAD domain-containing putative transcriptional regulator [Aeromicrobium sp.]|uniref:BTAD domain-containing putative transcriptional regulator n=1 Tax=Aeromicrobium sp. TaxID=1871063 RepID=UPI0039E54C97